MELPPAIARLSLEDKGRLLDSLWLAPEREVWVREVPELPDVSTFSVEQKLELAEALCAELEAKDPGALSAAWHEEILAERIAILDSDNVKLLDWEQVKAELTRKYL